jgi:hydroxypyruvate isomerase
MNWNLRYASHLGYVSPERPLFLSSVGSLDPVAHVDFAAELGFEGIQYAHALTRPAEERTAVGAAVARHGMEVTGILYTSFENLGKPLWVDRSPGTRDVLERALADAFATAGQLHCRNVIVVTGAHPRRPRVEQFADLAENLKWAADLADAAGVVLLVEAITAKRRPDLLLNFVADAHDVVRTLDAPSVRLMYDTGHVQSMEGDVIRRMEECWDAIDLIQVANQPGRSEMNVGELNFVSILRAIKRLGYAGLIELEHDWAAPSRDSERRGIEALREIDAALA